MLPELKKRLFHIEERYKFNVPYRKADEIKLVNKQIGKRYLTNTVTWELMPSHTFLCIFHRLVSVCSKLSPRLSQRSEQHQL